MSYVVNRQLESLYVIAARKRSFGQDNNLTGVCPKGDFCSGRSLAREGVSVKRVVSQACTVTYNNILVCICYLFMYSMGGRLIKRTNKSERVIYL